MVLETIILLKIFCFDWTLLKVQLNHKVKFIFHDSRLLSENDPRQVATIGNKSFRHLIGLFINTLL